MFVLDLGSCSPGSVIMGFVGFPIAVVLLVVRLVLSGAVPGPWAAWAMELCAPGVVVASGLVGQQWCTLLRWLVRCGRRACIVVVILCST